MHVPNLKFCSARQRGGRWLCTSCTTRLFIHRLFTSRCKCLLILATKLSILGIILYRKGINPHCVIRTTGTHLQRDAPRWCKIIIKLYKLYQVSLSLYKLELIYIFYHLMKRRVYTAKCGEI